MLQKSPSGTWMPAWVPESTTTLSMLLILCSIVQSAVSSKKPSLSVPVPQHPCPQTYPPRVSRRRPVLICNNAPLPLRLSGMMAPC